MRDEDKNEFRPKKGSVGKVKRIPSLGREVRMADTRTQRRRKDRIECCGVTLAVGRGRSRNTQDLKILRMDFLLRVMGSPRRAGNK